MDVNTNLKLIQEMREILISARVSEERKLEEFSKCISSVDKSVFEGIYIPDDISLKAFCPEAYEAEPDPDKYNEQYNAMMEIITPINNRMIEVNQKAVEALNKFKQMR